MKNVSLLSWLCALCLLVSLFSCQDHRLEPATSPFRLKRVIGQSRRTYVSYALNYNSSGRLTSYVLRSASGSFAEDSEGQTNLVNYDAQGRIVSIEAQPSSVSITRFQRYYEYDANNNLTVIKQYIAAQPSDPFRLNTTTTISYNSDKLPVKVTRVEATRTVESVYTYSGGNIIKEDYTDSGSSNGTVTYNYQYDDKPNPTYGNIGLVLYGVSTATINKNNTVNPDNQNTYDSNGLLTKVIVNYKQDSRDQGISSYEYEVYK